MQITKISPTGELSVLDLINALNLTPEGTCTRNAWLIDMTDAHLSLNQDDIHWFHTFFKHRPPRTETVSIAIITGAISNNADLAVISKLGDAMVALGMRVCVFDSNEENAAHAFFNTVHNPAARPASSA